MGEVNEGMQVGGKAAVNVTGSVAIGRQARAISRIAVPLRHLEQHGEDEIAKRLIDLQQAIAEHEDRLQDVDEVVTAVDTLARELAKQPPSRLTLKGILGAISSSVQSVAQIATAVDSLRRAMAHLL